MLNATPSQRHKILSLTLVFLLTGLLGCSHGSQGEQAAGATAKAAPSAGGAPPAGGAGSAPAGGAGAAPAGGASSAPAGAAPAASQAPAGAGSASPAAGGITAPAGTTAAKPAEPPLAPEKIPAVVAKVNGTPIAKTELIKMADQIHAQLAPNQPETAEFYRKVLDQLVSNELLLEEAKASGITASDEEVNKQVSELKGRFPSPEKYQEELKKEGLTEADLAKQAREAFVLQKLVETKVVNDVKVSDQQVKAFYDQNPDKLKRPERVHVRHILIHVDAKATAEDKKKARAKADDILAKVKAGGDFAKLAEESSDDPGSKQRGGDLSWVSRNQTVPPFESAAFGL
ncbi:MAG TPA: peptidylprolyl isomerase, partial [Thermoanaerobaculia bacterium]|nr:peptidylprolyl isomerase [Thermoanaerobaculia bacterium]